MAEIFDDIAVGTGRPTPPAGIFDDIPVGNEPRPAAAGIFDDIAVGRAAPTGPRAAEGLDALVAEDDRTRSFGDRAFDDIRRGVKTLQTSIAGGRIATEFDRQQNETLARSLIEGLAAEGDRGAQAALDKSRPTTSKIPELLSRIMTLRQEQAAIPRRPVVDAFFQSRDARDAVDVFLTDPLGFVGGIALESAAPSSLPLATGIAGAVVGGPVGFAAGLGTGSAGIEFGLKTLEEIERLGADLDDPVSVARVIEQNRDEIRKNAMLAGVAVGAFDAATGLVAGGAFGRLVPRSGGGVLSQRLRDVGEVGAQAVVQGAGGAAGEATKQAITPGEFSGTEIAAEFAGEFGFAPVEVAGAGAVGLRRQRGPQSAAPPLPGELSPRCLAGLLRLLCRHRRPARTSSPTCSRRAAPGSRRKNSSSRPTSSLPARPTSCGTTRSSRASCNRASAPGPPRRRRSPR